MGHGHGHGHGRGDDPDAGRRALAIAFVLNAVFLIIELVAGLWSGSLALLSDAGHMLSDVAALGIALLASWLANRPAPASYTFGLKRAPVVAAFVNALSLVAIAVFVGIEAVQRIADPPELHSGTIVVVGIAGLFVNVASALVLQRSGDRSLNARAAMLHLMADALGSVAAIIAGVLIGSFGWTLADPIASIVICLLIVASSLPLIRSAADVMLQRAPVPIDELRAVLLASPEVTEVSDLHCWCLEDGEPVVTARLGAEVSGMEAASALADHLRAELARRFSVVHATLEVRHANAPPIPCMIPSAEERADSDAPA